MVNGKSQLWRFKFTLKYDECPDEKILIRWLKANCKKWVFQHEKGEETGYHHYGGRLSLRKKKRVPEMINFVLKNNTKEINKMSVQPEVTENDDDFYDTKEETRIEGPWCDRDEEIYIPRQCREIAETLRPWQQKILDDVGIWNTRTINMIYDPLGNIGKSTFCTYMAATRKARQLPTVNDYKDLLGIVCDLPTSNMYLIDMPRALKKDKLGGLYSGIESIKGGFAFDMRYSYKEKFFDCPNIWVFSNVLPDWGMLSMDRWRIWKVNKETWELEEKNPSKKVETEVSETGGPAGPVTPGSPI